MMKYPFYKQHESQDCGVACLRMICKFYGKDVSQHELAERCHTNKVGTSLLDLCDAANSIGFHSIGATLNHETLFDKSPFPCVALWNKNHYVIIYGTNRGKVIVGDPAIGIIKYTKDNFNRHWCSDEGDGKGIVLLLQVTDVFKNLSFDPPTEDGTANMMKHVKPFRNKLIGLGLTIFIGSIISLAFPYLTGAIVDKGIESKNLHIVVLILIAQLCLTFGTFITRYIGNWISLHTSCQISISLIDDFIRKLTKLPLSFFDKRNVGDLITRIDDYTRIEHFLTSSIVSSIIALVGFLVYSIVLFEYEPDILVVFLLGSILYFLWIMVFLKKRRILDYVRFQELANNESNVLELINGMPEIKLNGCEDKKCREWDEIQNRIYKIKIKGLSLSQTQSIGGALIDQTKNLVISFLAAKGVIDGSITLGAMMAIQYIVGQMNTPMFQLIGFVSDYQDMKISTERINDIYLRNDEKRGRTELVKSQEIFNDICLKDVSFRYGGPSSKTVLKSINCSIPSGKITAIVGMSGSGKTTLMKLLLGFYSPSEGNIYIGSHNFEDVDRRAWRGQCGVVLQEGYIFSDSIKNNIAISEELVDDERVKNACKLACIDEYIEGLPMKYDTLVGQNGNNLSTGQKQRLMIARAIYKNAPYLFLDEATNSLDVNNEHSIIENLDKFYKGRTVVIIAHRLSTVKGADQILVLSKGEIIEKGSHSELISLKGAYYSLVREQLLMG